MKTRLTLTALIGLAMIFLSIPAQATSERNAIQGFTRSQFHGYQSTYAYILDKDGNILPGLNSVQDVGSPTETWRRVHTGSLDVSSGIANFHETFIDQPRASSAAYTSTSAIVTGMDYQGLKIATSTLLSAGTTYTMADFVGYKGTGAPTNVQVHIAFPAGNSTHSITGAAVFYGIDSIGKTVNESLTLSTRAIVGRVAWAYITSVTVSASSIPVANDSLEDANIYFNVGIASAIGLANRVENYDDVYKISEGSSTVISSGTVNVAGLAYIDTEYNTYTPVNQTDNARDYNIWYTNRKSRR